MAYRLDLPKPVIEQMIDATIKSMKRAVVSRPTFKELAERDIKQLQNALNTLTEVK